MLGKSLFGMNCEYTLNVGKVSTSILKVGKLTYLVLSRAVKEGR